MRTIKFRGKRLSDKSWVYGYYAKVNNSHFIIKPEDNIHGFIWNEVIPETVGQFTNVSDLENNELYEGDIVGRCFDDYNENCEICYLNGVLSARAIISNKYRPLNTIEGYGWCKVNGGSSNYNFRKIGNIHDNKELLSK